MSLVGSLEDLGLGDILQIVSLARKSGRLVLRTDGDTGRILVSDGLVRGAGTKGDPEDLHGLLVVGGEIDEGAFDEARALADRSEIPLDDALQEAADLQKEQVDRLRREQVERAVLRMFSWRNGEFSFEVCDEPDPEGAELLLSTGINTQYLAMEATRLRDESGLLGDPLNVEPPDDEPMFSGEEPDLDPKDSTPPADSEDSPGPLGAAVEALALASAHGVGDDDVTLAGFEAPHSGGDPDVTQPDDSLRTGDDCSEPAGAPPEPGEAEVTAPDHDAAPPAPADRGTRDAVAIETVETAAPQPVAVEVRARVADPAPLVAIDPSLPGLEWVKLSAGETFPRVHIFLQGEAGMDRIRRYLMRGVRPLVLASPELLDPRDGASGLLARMRALAPEMLVLGLLSSRDQATPEGFDGSVVRPASLPADRSQWELGGALAGELREVLVEATQRSGRRPAGARSGTGSALKSLREVSDRLRAPGRRGDVLSLVLEFAGRELSRVAVLQMRDDVAVGIAQRGLPRSGGAGDRAMSELRFTSEELPELFVRALEERRGVRGRLSDVEIAQMSELLGSSAPFEAYVGPIESGGCVAALVYADNLPLEVEIADTTALEIVLHEAGMALDRALLERELAEARGTA